MRRSVRLFVLVLVGFGAITSAADAARRATSAERRAIRIEFRSTGGIFARARVDQVVVSTVGRYARARTSGPRLDPSVGLFRGQGRRWRYVRAVNVSDGYPCGLAPAVIADLQLMRFSAGRCSEAPELFDPLEARIELFAARLMPPPLFPTVLPRRVRRSDTTLALSAPHFNVHWSRGFRDARGYLSLGRASYENFDATLEQVHARGFQERPERIGGRDVLYVCGHVCGFVWREGAFTYNVFGDYPQTRGDADEKDMRAIIRRLQPLAAP